jgi:glycosyltransferase involved in cell wall biosynthesis
MKSNTASLDLSLKVTILMGICNGADHLIAQLESISRQTHTNWHLICSDDGSIDNSLEILHNFATTHPGQVTMKAGPCRGFSDNFMSLIRGLPKDSGYVGFADQDDIWLPEKLARALFELSKRGPTPALYCGRQSYWFPKNNRQINSPKMSRPFLLRNALIENVATGNTVMLNPAAARLARRAAYRTASVFAHDWWLYLVMTATGSTIHFDNGPPAILYRQHARNAIGAGKGLLPQARRKAGVLRGAFSRRIDGNLQALFAIEDLLTPQSVEICSRFSQARQASTWARLTAIHRIAPYRQRRADTLGFWGAASLGRA